MVEPSVPPLDEDQRSPQARHSLWLSRDEGVPDLPDTCANLRVRPLSPHRPRDCTGVAAYQSQLPAEIEPIAVEEEPRREAACGVRGLRPNLDLVAIRGQSLGQTPVAPVLYPRRSLGWARRLWKKGRNECTRCSRSRRSHRTRGTHLLLPLESSSSGPTSSTSRSRCCFPALTDPGARLNERTNLLRTHSLQRTRHSSEKA